MLTVFPEALACYHEENSLNFGSDDPAAKRRRLEAELEETSLRQDARRQEEIRELQHKQNLKRQEQEAELNDLEFRIKKTKLEKELEGEFEERGGERGGKQVSTTTGLVTVEMAKLFAQTYMTLAESLEKASRIGEVHKALAKVHGFEKTPQKQREAFAAAGFVARKCYFREGKPYKLM